MSIKVLILNLSRGIGRRLAFGLAMCALSVAGNAMAVKSTSAQAQDQKRETAQETEVGKARHSTTSALPTNRWPKQKALDYYNQALPLLRAAGDRNGEAQTLGNIGDLYEALGEKQKATDIHKQADEASARR